MTQRGFPLKNTAWERLTEGSVDSCPGDRGVPLLVAEVRQLSMRVTGDLLQGRPESAPAPAVAQTSSLGNTPHARGVDILGGMSQTSSWRWTSLA